MGHELVYLGEGNYSCGKCGEKTDRAGVPALTASRCAGDTPDDKLNAASGEIAVISGRIDEILARLEAAEAVLGRLSTGPQ